MQVTSEDVNRFCRLFFDSQLVLHSNSWFIVDFGHLSHFKLWLVVIVFIIIVIVQVFVIHHPGT